MTMNTSVKGKPARTGRRLAQIKKGASKMFDRIANSWEQEEPHNNGYYPYFIASLGKPVLIHATDLLLTNEALLEQFFKDDQEDLHSAIGKYFYKIGDIKVERQPNKSWFKVRDVKDNKNEELRLDKKIFFVDGIIDQAHMVRLPNHACIVQQYPIAVFGGVGTSKTVTLLSILIHARRLMCNASVTLHVDYPAKSAVTQEIDLQKMALQNNGILPPATDPKNNLRESIDFLVGYAHGSEQGEKLLTYTDFPGEASLEDVSESLFTEFKNILFFIDAEEIIASWQGKNNDLNSDILQNLIEAVNLDQCHLDVIVSKSDLLREYLKEKTCTKEQSELIARVLANPSLEVKEHQLVQVIHKNGFDKAAFRAHSEAVKALLMNSDYPFVHDLDLYFSPLGDYHRVDYMAISALGCSPITQKEDGIEEEWRDQLRIDPKAYCPINLDLPLVSMFSGLNMIPSKESQKPPEDQDNWCEDREQDPLYRTRRKYSGYAKQFFEGFFSEA